MVKKSVNIKINESELKLLKENMPKQYDSLSDLLRSAALAVVKGESSSTEMTVFRNLIYESEKKIMSEIEKNRKILYSVLEYTQFQDRQELEILEAEYSQQLIQLWQKDFAAVKQHGTIEELEGSVQAEHLKEVVLDALLILQDQGKVRISNNKLRWL